MKAYALNPNDSTHSAFLLGRAYWQKGMYEEALRWWEVAGFSEVGRARYDAVTGQPEKMLGMIEDKALWAQGDAERLLWSIATTYAALGEKDQALDWLERAYEARLGILVYVKVEPLLYPLHGEPRFQALLKKMGLD